MEESKDKIEAYKTSDSSLKVHEDAKILSRIGQKIISCLSVSEIISTVYEEVNKVMDATSMNFGLYNKEKNRLEFPGTMERGHKLEFHWADLDETHKLPVVCYIKELEILINDLQTGVKKYTGHDPVSLSDDGEIVAALIYIPLYSKEVLIGVISVQSFQKDSYTEYHLDILKNIGNYVGIAIENAQAYKNLEEKIEARTKEIVEQKNEIEKTYKNFTTISEIGKNIISSLSVEEIIEKAYDNVNSLMDAAAFGIGIYNESLGVLGFSGAIESGEKLPYSVDKLDKNSYAASCFLGNKKVVINSTSEFQNIKKKARVGKVPESLIYLPLKSTQGTIGVITVQSFTENAYTPYHIDILETLANYTAIALENAKSFENLSALSSIGRKISSSLDIISVLQTLYESVNNLMDAPIFLVSSYSHTTNVLSYEFCMEKGKQILHGYTTDLQDERDNFSAWVVHNKKEIIIHDNEKEYKNYIDKPYTQAGATPSSLIFIPLIVEENVIGVISVQSLKKNAYTLYHLELLRTLASYVSAALNNAIAFKELNATRQEMEKLSLVASETDNAVIIMDAEGNFEWVNKAYEEMTGFNLKSLIKNIGKGIKNIDDNELKRNLSAVYKTKKSVSFESSFMSKYGTKIWVQTNISPVLNKQNEIVKLVALDSNITERKKSEIKIQEKNKDITDSINYASRIQRAMLPQDDVIKDILPNSFILYKPRDIVSGDFYWTTKTKDGSVIVAVVDCTGHGVPGAFLTIIGNNLLNQIINFDDITDPSDILNRMNREILNRFEGSSQGGMKDGMDMSICKIDYNNNDTHVNYAGAISSLYCVANNKIKEIKGNRFAVGTPLKNNPIYTSHSLILKKGDTIYLSSDGYQDQFGGPKNKKFKKTNFSNTLLEASKLSITNQRNMLNDTFEEWKGYFSQVDDILVFGVTF